MKHNYKIQGRPFSIQIELCQGCNKTCTFCGLQGIYGPGGNKLGNSEGTQRTSAPFFHMTVEIADELAQQCAEFIPNARYEFAMHGEPTLNPDYLEIFRIFRSYLPDAQIQLTTNGVRFRNGKMQNAVREILDAGIDYIILDTYEPERSNLVEQAKQLVGIDLIDYYDQPDGKPKVSPWHNHRRKLQNTVILMDDIGLVSGKIKNRVIYNHAGNAEGVEWPEAPMEKVCTLPFREITVNWDGSVNLCCMDFAHEYKTGNVTKKTLKDIWYGPEFTAARAALRTKNRRFTPCARCNYFGGFRPGLLPDAEPLTEDHKATIHRVVIEETTKQNRYPSFVDLDYTRTEYPELIKQEPTPKTS